MTSAKVKYVLQVEGTICCFKLFHSHGKNTYFVKQYLQTQGPHIVYHLEDIICGIPYMVLTVKQENSA